MRMMRNLTPKEKLDVTELEGLEAWVNDNRDLTDALKAKQYTCLAHDWLALDFEDRAVRLFAKANRVFPKYYKSQMFLDGIDDPAFAIIGLRISTLLIALEVEGSGLNH